MTRECHPRRRVATYSLPFAKNVQGYLSSEPSRMDQLSASKQLVAALLLLVACVATHFGAASAQYGNSGAAGTGPSDGAGYLLGVAAAVVAVAAFVWT